MSKVDELVEKIERVSTINKPEICYASICYASKPLVPLSTSKRFLQKLAEHYEQEKLELLDDLKRYIEMNRRITHKNPIPLLDDYFHSFKQQLKKENEGG